MYEDMIRAFVYDVLKHANDGELHMTEKELISIYTFTKMSNLKRLGDGVLDSDVWKFTPFVEVEEHFDIDENYRIWFDVVYSPDDGISSISLVIVDKKTKEETLVLTD